MPPFGPLTGCCSVSRLPLPFKLPAAEVANGVGGVALAEKAEDKAEEKKEEAKTSAVENGAAPALHSYS